LCKFLGHVQVVNRGRDLQAVSRRVLAADQRDGVVVVVVLGMQQFGGLFGAEIAAARLQIVVKQVPDDRGPSVVQHPLNHPGGVVLVAAVGFEHGTNAFIVHQLRFSVVVLQVGGSTVTRVQSVAIDLHVLKSAAAGVVVPGFADRPQLLFGNEFL